MVYVCVWLMCVWFMCVWFMCACGLCVCGLCVYDLCVCGLCVSVRQDDEPSEQATRAKEEEVCMRLFST